MEVHYHEPNEMTDVAYHYHADLIELAGAVDFLVVTCTSGPETDGLINGRVLSALGSGGVLVYMARRAVDEAALIDALENGVIAGAALDTFAHEPRVPDALTAMENVVLQAHMGTKTWETKRAFAARTAANLGAHFAGAPLPDPVP
jgi:hydroxypyruvate reductase